MTKKNKMLKSGGDGSVNRRRRRRRAVPKTVENTCEENTGAEVFQDDQGADASTAQSDTISTPIHDAQTDGDTQTVEPDWDSMPSKGYFSGRPGPGRPKSTERSEEGEGNDSQTGEGVDLLKAFLDALRVYGPQKYCRELLKKSPVSAAQLLANLRKNELPDSSVNVIMPAGDFPLPGGQDVQHDVQDNPDDVYDPDVYDPDVDDPAAPAPADDDSWDDLAEFAVDTGGREPRLRETWHEVSGEDSLHADV